MLHHVRVGSEIFLVEELLIDAIIRPQGQCSSSLLEKGDLQSFIPWVPPIASLSPPIIGAVSYKY